MGGCISRISAPQPTSDSSSPSHEQTARTAPTTPGRTRQSSILDGLPPSGALSQRNKAATTIQAHWRGGQIRDLMATAAQESAPYPNETHYKMATNGYSGKAQRVDALDGPRGNNGWLPYAWAHTAPRNSLALLHSFQRKDKLEETKQTLYNGAEPDGVVYNPYGTHDMRTNCAWLLGVAHRGISAVMTVELDDVTVVRSKARKNAPVEEQTTASNLSALAREVVGMTQSGHFRVGEPLHDMQVLVPNPSAAKATLNDFKTPFGMPQDELKRKLDEAGINTDGLRACLRSFCHSSQKCVNWMHEKSIPKRRESRTI